MRSSASARGAALAAVLAGGGACNLVYDFTLTPQDEVAALCADGFDNDFNGLLDCQEWSCLGEHPCCTIPEVVLEDSFDNGVVDCAAASCTDVPCQGPTCPDATRWHTWRCPYPQVCGGALWPAKSGSTQCLPSGVLGRPPLALEPGLAVTVGVVGRPETQGYLEVGLTTKDETDLVGALDPCGVSAQAEPFVSIRQRREGEGYVLAARFLGTEIGASPLVVSVDDEHEAAFSIDDDRRIVFLLDGTPFATAGEPVPAAERETRVVLEGLTETARFSFARVVAGRLCESPAAWQPVLDEGGSFVAVAPQVGTDAWDRADVNAPSVRRRVDGAVELFYSGCWGVDAGECDPLRISLGRAVGALGGPLAREDLPLMSIDDFPVGAGVVAGALTFRALDHAPPAGFASVGDSIFIVEGTFGAGDLPAIILSREAGAWDEAIGAAHGIRFDQAVRVWYAGRDADETWRIGLATAPDGHEFARHPGNPILFEGTPEAFDGKGVRDPVVLYDPVRRLYRMWYVGVDFFGDTAIGYAVSADGVTWSKSPDNPVVRPDDVGLLSVASPAVLLEDSGRLWMWLEGAVATAPGHVIVGLSNGGAPPD